VNEETLNSTHQAAASHGASQAAHDEFPNFITVLTSAFPDAGWNHFLHQWENVIFSLLVALLISITAIVAARHQHLIPSSVRNFCEVIVEGIKTFVIGLLGERGVKYVPFLGTLFLYILFSNWMGLLPFFKSPTASLGTTLAVALITLAYVQYNGIKEQGFGHYLKHMAGNPSNVFGFILIPLMLVINLMVEFGAVPLSLSLRLFANVSSEDLLLFKFAELNVLFKGLLFLFQIFANVLAIVFSLVQAFVFMLLATVYLSLILPHEDHDHAEGDAHELAHAH
jgi:F-type H+-transporting ATPase subunit a